MEYLKVMEKSICPHLFKFSLCGLILQLEKKLSYANEEFTLNG